MRMAASSLSEPDLCNHGRGGGAGGAGKMKKKKKKTKREKENKKNKESVRQPPNIWSIIWQRHGRREEAGGKRARRQRKTKKVTATAVFFFSCSLHLPLFLFGFFFLHLRFCFFSASFVFHFFFLISLFFHLLRLLFQKQKSSPLVLHGRGGSDPATNSRKEDKRKRQRFI